MFLFYVTAFINFFITGKFFFEIDLYYVFLFRFFVILNAKKKLHVTPTKNHFTGIGNTNSLVQYCGRHAQQTFAAIASCNTTTHWAGSIGATVSDGFN